MTEAGGAQAAVQAKLATSARPRWNRLNPLEALDRGFVLFRSTFAHESWRYYVGAVPLILCFIPIWVIDGQIQISNGVLLAESASLAAAYLLRAWMITGYMQRVRERAFGMPAARRPGAAVQAAMLGRLLAWKITLSAAALATLPSVAGASWFYSACQFASLESRDEAAERHSFAGCIAFASQCFGVVLLLFLMLFPLWIAVWLNGFILALIVPALLHSVFGVDTLLSTEMGIYALLQSSAFWLALFAGAWLALDPIVKCTFVVIHQHLRSRREGDDLRGLLASLPREQQKKADMVASGVVGRGVRIGALLAVMGMLLGAPQSAVGRPVRVPPAQSGVEGAASPEQQARVRELRQALTVESNRAIYRWHDASHPEPPTWLDKLLAKIGHAIGRALNAVWNFLHRFWPKGWSLSSGNEKGGWHLRDLRLWLALLAALTLAAGAILFWLRRRRETAQLSIPMAAAPLPDLTDASVASERSEDEWFALASRLEREGDLRLALRAAYLGLLAGLAHRDWLTIRRDRTNREYLDEFTRRWRRRPQAAVEVRAEIPEKLRGSLRLFDQVWYGSHALTPVAVSGYRQDQRELLNHV